MRYNANEVRKADTRRKIELGGLVIKAGLGAEDAAVILGIILDGKRRISGSDASSEREKFVSIGARELRTKARENEAG